VNVELQVTSAPATLQAVSDVTVTPSAKVCTDRWVAAPVRHTADDVPGFAGGLLGLLGELPPPLHARAPAQMVATAQP